MGFEFTFRPDMNLLQTILMFRGGFAPRRVAALERYMAYTAAQTMLKNVTAKIPQTPDYKAYRESLKVSQSGVPSSPIFSVDSVEPKAEEVEKDTDLLFFKVKGKGRLDPGLKVLLEYQPWTQDTLPFTPPLNKAELKKRKVSKQTVIEVAQARAKDRPEWSRKLSEAGIRVDKSKAATLPDKATAVPDLMYTALRLEFGLGGAKAVAHWRPALQTTQTQMVKLFEGSDLGRVLLGWKDSRWQKWRDLKADPTTATAAGSYAGFQSKITK